MADLGIALREGTSGDLSAAAALKRVTAGARAHKLGLAHHEDPLRLETTGWAVVCHSSEIETLREALRPLLDLRALQTGAESRVLQYNGEDCRRWLESNEVEPGCPRADTVPYYLLLAGDPEKIPFEFEHKLAPHHAVGRLAFDSAAEYRRYAETMVRYETGRLQPRARRVALFGPKHDRQTKLAADHLGHIAQRGLKCSEVPSSTANVELSVHLGDNATKAELAHLLSGQDARCAVLVTATHGLGADPDDPEQRDIQGALLCDWPGSAIRPEHYLAAADVHETWDVAGLITVHLACFSGGTPTHDRFGRLGPDAPKILAKRPFVAALANALLGHPAGGAISCIAHVDRAWNFSFSPNKPLSPNSVFERLLTNLICGEPVGHAVRDLRSRFTFAEGELAEHLHHMRLGASISLDELTYSWLNRNDAQAYAVLGDPAVRLRHTQTAELP